MDNTPKLPGYLTLAETVRKLTEKHLKDEPAIKLRMFAEWHKIAGAEISGMCLPLDIIYQRGTQPQSVLKLKVAEGFATELNYLLPQLQERISLYFGYKAIDRFQVVVGVIKNKI